MAILKPRLAPPGVQEVLVTPVTLKREKVPPDHLLLARNYHLTLAHSLPSQVVKQSKNHEYLDIRLSLMIQELYQL